MAGKQWCYLDYRYSQCQDKADSVSGRKWSFQVHTKCPKIYSKSLLHLNKFTANIYSSSKWFAVNFGISRANVFLSHGNLHWQQLKIWNYFQIRPGFLQTCVTSSKPSSNISQHFCLRSGEKSVGSSSLLLFCLGVCYPFANQLRLLPRPGKLVCNWWHIIQLDSDTIMIEKNVLKSKNSNDLVYK